MKRIVVLLVVLASCSSQGRVSVVISTTSTSTTSTSTSTTSTSTTSTTQPTRVLAKVLVKPVHKPVKKPVPVKRSVLQVAQGEVGQLWNKYGIKQGFKTDTFWCAKFISYVLTQAGHPYHDERPGDLALQGVGVDIQAGVGGDIGLIQYDEASDHGQVQHVFVIEAPSPGGYLTIEGNSDQDTTKVVRGFREYKEFVGIRRIG